MRTSKKIVSLVLAVLMVVTMMSVMAVSAGAVGENFEVVALGTDATGAVGDKFVNINDAMNAAGNNGEIKLIADMEFDGNSGYIFVSAKQSTTFDLNGHTITSNGTSGINFGSVLPGVYTFTIKDTSAAQTGEIITTVNNNQGCACLSGNTGREIVIESGKFTSNGKAVYAEGKGATINGGTLDGDVYGEAPVEINGGTVNGDVTVTGNGFYFDSGWTSHSDNTTATITGGTVNGEFTQGNDSTNTITVTGGAFTADVSAYVDDSVLDVVEVNGAKIVVSEGTSLDGKAAVIGSNAYDTLEDALAAVNNGETITLLADHNSYVDINNGKTFTINLNENAISHTSGTVYVMDANVTFTNGTIEGTNNNAVVVYPGSVATLGEGAVVESANQTVLNYGTVNTEAGSVIRATSTANNTTAYYGTAGSVANLGGTIESSTYYGIILKGADATANVSGEINSTGHANAAVTNGGDIVLNDGANLHGADFGVAVTKSGSTVTVNDGATVSASNTAIAGNGTADDAGYEININGGTIEGGSLAVYHPNEGTLTITGGELEGASAVEVKAGTTEITGGTFTGTSGDAIVVTPASGYQDLESVAVSGGEFSDESAYEYVANDAFVIKDAEGNTVVSDTMPGTTTAIEADDQLGVSAQNITNHAILGYQNAAVTSNAAYENQDCVRIITAVNEGFLKGDNIADYGYVVAKYNGSLSNAELSTPMANILKYNNDNFKRISCKGTSNTVASNPAYGDFNADSTYKYVTLAIGDMNYGDKVIARFYIKTKDGKVYYSQYQEYSGILATYE